MLSGRVLDSRPKGRGFEPHWCHCVVSLSKSINPSLVLVQPRKTRPCLTERLLMERKESKQTNSFVLNYDVSNYVPWIFCPVLFPIFINDLQDNIRSSVCLLADGSVLYRSMYSLQDCLTMQEVLTSL